jgi:acetyltransferase-like isoleucine patch superfamily enzyme
MFMKTRLDQVLECYLNGREIAVWGSPTRLLLRTLKQYKFHIAEIVDPKKHYVVLVNEDDLCDFLIDEQSKHFKHVDDYLTFNDLGGELPFEWECFGVKIGRQTYFGEAVAGACQEGYIESIGQFTSINGTAEIAVDHQHNMTFVSDDIQNFFTDKNMDLFRNKYLADPKHPYATNKCRITIGSDVWIGAYSFINASKVKSIGDGAIIGAGAVVLEDVPPYAVVVGIPAKVKRYRYSPEMINTLLCVKWWDWTIEEINANADALISPEIFMARFGN